MCDAEYIDKKKLKVITFEKLLKKWDNTHYKKLTKILVYFIMIIFWKWVVIIHLQKLKKN